MSNSEKWIRIFDIPDTSKHKKGFTIYKVISLLYPETCPDAVTKITVWKRYNDLKKVHREIKLLHKKFNLKDKYPSLPSATFFNRFDDEVVQTRRQSILNFLEYVGSHYQLFTSKEFVNFFESSHMPLDQMKGNINFIKADLNLPDEPEFCTKSDDELTVSDTDSVSTVNSLSLSQHLKLNASLISQNSDSTSTSSFFLLDGSTPPNTPGLMNTDNCVQYIVDASIHINLAVELENRKKFEDAFTAYKAATDILIKYGKDDKNYDRKQMIQYKIEKYLLRAEKIYNMYLAPEVKNLKEIYETKDYFVERPFSDLYKYKVVKIIASGMLVLHSETQKLFYIKVIHKSMKFLNENLILPENVPYMVKLNNYYNCENALFLVLEYCSGMKLRDYIMNLSCNKGYSFTNENVFKLEDSELSDTESEHSYSDLINDYTNSKINTKSNKTPSISDSFEKLDFEDFSYCNKKNDDILNNKKFESIEKIENQTKNFTNMNINDNCAVKSRIILDTDKEDKQKFLAPIECVVKWSAQLLLALEKLHVLGVICCDLQMHNILIDDNRDLNLTYMCNIKELSDVFSTGNFLYLAPESYNFQPFTKTIDWWYFGTILYEMLVGMPLSVMYPDGLSSYTNLKIPKYVSPEGRSLLRQLLTHEPNHRLGNGINGTENLKSHPFFHSVSWDELISKYNC